MKKCAFALLCLILSACSGDGPGNSGNNTAAGAPSDPFFQTQNLLCYGDSQFNNGITSSTSVAFNGGKMSAVLYVHYKIHDGGYDHGANDVNVSLKCEVTLYPGKTDRFVTCKGLNDRKEKDEVILSWDAIDQARGIAQSDLAGGVYSPVSCRLTSL